MPNGFEQFAQNAMALGAQWREERKQKKMAEALSQFDIDPAAAIAGVTKVDPITGYNMRRQLAADAMARKEAQRAQATETLKTVTGLLRPVADDPNATPESIAKAYDGLAPLLHDGLGMQPDEIAKWRTMIATNPAILRDMDEKLQVVPPGAAVTRGGKEVYRNPGALKTITVRRGDGGYDVIQVDPNGQPVSGPPRATVPAGPTTPDAAWNFIRPHEGGYAPHDANGAPVNFGINQAANPGVDVKNLTEDQAKQIFIDKYFNPSGAGNLPGPLGVMHADTYYINPRRAQQFLQESGGDPQKYLQLRQAWQNNLVRTQPGKYGKYAEAWQNRNEDLATMANGGAAPSQGGGLTPVYTTPGKASGPSGAAAHILTPEEVQAAGLNPNVKWQINHLGDYVMIGPASQLSPANTKKQSIYESIDQSTSRMIDAAKELLNHPGLERAVGVNSYFPSVKGGKAADFDKALESFKAQIGFAVLQNMRQMSPTGGALGQVSNYENRILQNSLASLDEAQSPAQFRANVLKIIKDTNTTRERFKRAYQMDFANRNGGQSPTTTAPPKEAVDMLRSNPSPQRRQQFDQIFGNGAAKKVLGGGGSAENNFSRLMPIGQPTPYGTRL
jgi:hypothetical protein